MPLPLQLEGHACCETVGQGEQRGRSLSPRRGLPDLPLPGPGQAADDVREFRPHPAQPGGRSYDVRGLGGPGDRAASASGPAGRGRARRSGRWATASSRAFPASAGSTAWSRVWWLVGGSRTTRSRSLGMMVSLGMSGRLWLARRRRRSRLTASSRRRARRTRTRRPRSPTILLLEARSRWSADCLIYLLARERLF